MPERSTLERARRDRAEGKSASTQAGEFVREEIHHIRAGKHGARSAKQAIAIGLSKARRAGIRLPPPRKGSVSQKTQLSAARESRQAREHPRHRPASNRSRATLRALQREGGVAASHWALARHARTTAHQRTSESRSSSARKAAHTRSKAE